jgi:hypothetical protein
LVSAELEIAGLVARRDGQGCPFHPEKFQPPSTMRPRYWA